MKKDKETKERKNKKQTKERKNEKEKKNLHCKKDQLNHCIHIEKNTNGTYMLHGVKYMLTFIYFH